LTELVPLIDGSAGFALWDPAGLTVELIDDMSWMFASLEPEPGGESMPGSKNVLSLALTCWLCGCVLASLPGRAQLQAALRPRPTPTDRNMGVGSGAEGMQSLQPRLLPARPLPVRLACFAVRTLQESVQAIAQGEIPTPINLNMPSETRLAERKWGGGDTVASSTVEGIVQACRSCISPMGRVGLIVEQMPSWRHRRAERGVVAVTKVDADDSAPPLEDALACRAAASEVLDSLVVSLCAAVHHERVSTLRRERAEAAGSKRRPTGFSSGSVNSLASQPMLALTALFETVVDKTAPAMGGKGKPAASLSSSHK
ncbi:unnamed protein product, partial [Choristocarpus tenellus]